MNTILQVYAETGIVMMLLTKAVLNHIHNDLKSLLFTAADD